MGKVERMGSGIDRMRDFMRDAGLKEPVFETDNFFRVIFYRKPSYSLKQTSETVVKTVGETVAKTVVKILALIKDNPKITRAELATQTDLTIRGVEWNLRKLKDDGAIRRVGSAKGGHWEVDKTAETETKKT